jgi:hypothetical protein
MSFSSTANKLSCLQRMGTMKYSQMWILVPLTAMFQAIGFRSFIHRMTRSLALTLHPWGRLACTEIKLIRRSHSKWVHLLERYWGWDPSRTNPPRGKVDLAASHHWWPNESTKPHVESWFPLKVILFPAIVNQERLPPLALTKFWTSFGKSGVSSASHLWQSRTHMRWILATQDYPESWSLR